MRRDGRFEDETECHKSHKFCQLPPSLRCRGGFPDWESAKKKENLIQSRFWKKSAHVVEHRTTVLNDTGSNPARCKALRVWSQQFLFSFSFFLPICQFIGGGPCFSLSCPGFGSHQLTNFKGAAKWLDGVKNWVEHGKGLLTLLLLRNALTLNRF